LLVETRDRFSRPASVGRRLLMTLRLATTLGPARALRPI
jgi:hypothetical protein